MYRTINHKRMKRIINNICTEGGGTATDKAPPTKIEQHNNILKYTSHATKGNQLGVCSPPRGFRISQPDKAETMWQPQLFSSSMFRIIHMRNPSHEPSQGATQECLWPFRKEWNRRGGGFAQTTKNASCIAHVTLLNINYYLLNLPRPGGGGGRTPGLREPHDKEDLFIKVPLIAFHMNSQGFSVAGGWWFWP